MKMKKTLSLALVLVMIISLLAGCGAQQTAELQQAFSSDAVLSQVYPENGGTVNLHTKKQESYLNKAVCSYVYKRNRQKRAQQARKRYTELGLQQ